MEHHHRSRIRVRHLRTDPETWASVANRPPDPDLDGRGNVPDAAIPRRGDKEVFKIVLKASVTNVPDSGLPGVILTANRADSSPLDFVGQFSSSAGFGQYDSAEFNWWPDVGESVPTTDTIVIDLEDDPILWEQTDLFHLAAVWDGGDVMVEAELFWRHA